VRLKKEAKDTIGFAQRMKMDLPSIFLAIRYTTEKSSEQSNLNSQEEEALEKENNN